ncbi:SLATT domain-containing protein [Campylobacter lari]|uniref:SLATT domain-containing protein n=1 Tax=unclassified Campylobacter TaxID=2593542 RepID=UPI0021E635BE|nr:MULTISPECIES: SLATT domain-containing protein [unclassified Campylobacter]MCV3377839.1 SLATT domain-containing protein [Campylobacter sp. IFREMER_LSEM_CL2194]MCV3498547.1 SLATT domain-containing protein [Campylobacter lari]MCV3549313.1 SLATT domain-containing protein [Campylobacter sp. CNRCH_2013_0671h]
MTKEDLLRQIAESAYNIGFGAKKSFATFDIVDKIPNMLSFCSLAIGILALFIDELNIKIVSASLIIFGIIGIYISKYYDKKNIYKTSGSEITKLFNELKSLYYSVKAKPNDANFDKDVSKMKEIENKFYSIAISEQILFSDWYAHYKFFWQWATHIKWLEDELKLTFCKNKIPLSFVVFVGVILLLIFIIFISYCSYLS